MEEADQLYPDIKTREKYCENHPKIKLDKSKRCEICEGYFTGAILEGKYFEIPESLSLAKLISKNFLVIFGYFGIRLILNIEDHVVLTIFLWIILGYLLKKYYDFSNDLLKLSDLAYTSNILIDMLFGTGFIIIGLLFGNLNISLIILGGIFYLQLVLLVGSTTTRKMFQLSSDIKEIYFRNIKDQLEKNGLIEKLKYTIKYFILAFLLLVILALQSIIPIFL